MFFSESLSCRSSGPLRIRDQLRVRLRDAYATPALEDHHSSRGWGCIAVMQIWGSGIVWARVRSRFHQGRQEFRLSRESSSVRMVADGWNHHCFREPRVAISKGGSRIVDRRRTVSSLCDCDLKLLVLEQLNGVSGRNVASLDEIDVECWEDDTEVGNCWRTVTCVQKLVNLTWHVTLKLLQGFSSFLSLFSFFLYAFNSLYLRNHYHSSFIDLVPSR